jgi:DNA uptake protein ComE-like DNA-binding protein
MPCLKPTSGDSVQAPGRLLRLRLADRKNGLAGVLVEAFEAEHFNQPPEWRKRAMLKKAVLMVFATTLVASACTRNESSRREAGRSDTETRDTEQSVTRQSPGQLDTSPEQEKGQADVTVQKETTTTKRETDKERIPTVEQKQARADINRMGKDDFVAMGLSEQEAERIVENSDDHGDFSSPDQLRKVPGMNMTWLQQNSSKLGVS